MTTFDDFMPDASSYSSADLDVLRLGETPVVIGLFTFGVATVQTHFVDVPSLRAELHCNVPSESACLLCHVQQPRTNRAVLPVYDVEGDQIRALLVTDSRHPHALGPQLKAEFGKGDLANRYLVVTRKGNKFTVKTVSADASARRGEAEIARFVSRLQANEIDLRRAVAQLRNAQLWEITELDRKATALGLKRSDYADRAASDTNAGPDQQASRS